MSGEDTRAPCLLLDASIFIFRYYFSLPDHWSSDEGYGTGALYGYTAFLLRLLQAQRPRQIGACFDESLNSCFRNRLYPAYKSSRVLPDEALAFQLQACREVTEMLGIATYASDEYEADDLIGSLLAGLQRQVPQTPVAVLTRDKDLGQLLTRPGDYLWDYGARAAEPLYREHIEARFGVLPEQLADYLALVGDPVDDIPGVPGVGARTAAALLAHGGDLEGLYRDLDGIAALPIRTRRSLADKLRQYRPQVLLARRLTGIVTDLPLALAPLQRGPVQAEALLAFCRAMGFGGRLDRSIRQLAEVDGPPPAV